LRKVVGSSPVFRIRIHGFPDPDPAVQAEYQSGSGSRVLMTNNGKNLQLKRI
jgi:hypothetical protein